MGGLRFLNSNFGTNKVFHKIAQKDIFTVISVKQRISCEQAQKAKHQNETRVNNF